MSRRQLLTDEQWARLLAPPSDEREIIRYWALERAKKSRSSRLMDERFRQTIRERAGYRYTYRCPWREPIRPRTNRSD